MKKKFFLLAVSILTLTACGNDEGYDNGEEYDSVEVEVSKEDNSLIVAESAEKTAQNVADRYDYEMVEPVPSDAIGAIVDYWEFEKYEVYANPDGGMMHVGGTGLTKEEAEEFINNENFPITKELQSILDATSFDDFYKNGVSTGLPSEYSNNFNGLTLVVRPQLTSDDEVFFAVLLSIKP